MFFKNKMGDYGRALQVITEMMYDRQDLELARALENHEYACMEGAVNSLKVTDRMWIMFVMTPKIRFADIQKELEKAHKQGVQYCLIVFRDSWNASTEKNIKRKAQDELKMKYQVFKLAELQYNMSKHFLVPKHEIMTSEEEKHVMHMYSVKSKSVLPSLLKTDPMARYLFAKSGDLVKITRESGVFIRHVV